MVDVLLWYLIIQFTGVAGFLLIFKFLPNLPDRGYGFAKPFGLLIWTYIFWQLASLQVIQNTPAGIFVTILIVLLLAGWAFYKQKKEILDWIKNHKKTILTTEIVFLVAFAVMLFMRSASPDIAGTEKPMEMAFINAILRSVTFPPFDPWLSGYAISYYYFGYVMVALLTRTSGVLPSVAFNLAISMWFAMTAMGANSILYALLFHWKKKDKGEEKAEQLGLSISWLAPFFILIVSNLEGFLQALHRTGFTFTVPGGNGGTDFWTWLNIQEINTPPILPYSFNPLTQGWWFWRASRVVQDFNFSDIHFNKYIEVIDEFPFFTYYLADLHPHVLAMPFVLLVIGLAANLYFGRRLFFKGEGLLSWLNRWKEGERGSIKELRIFQNVKTADFWLLALVLGGLAFLNTWDFPIYTGLICLVVLFAGYERQGWHWGLFELVLESGISLGIVGYIFYIPFFVGFSSQAGGILPSLIFFTRGTFIWVMFGSLLLPIIFWIVWLWFKQGREGFPWKGIRAAAVIIFGLWLLSYALSILISFVPTYGNMFLDGIQGAGGANVMMVIAESLIRRVSSFGGWLTFLVMITILWELLPYFKGRLIPLAGGTTAEQMAANGEDPDRVPSINMFVLILIIMGIGLTMVPEFFYLRDNFGTRMNTIFKFYFQAWIIWGLAASFCMVVLLSQRGIFRWVFFVISFMVLAAALVYPAAGFVERINNLLSNPPTLDGAAFIAKYAPDDGAAITWLRAAPKGVLAEAVGGSYTDYARMSTYSGQPTVLGWPGHEDQWRGGNKEMGSRQQDIETLYKTNRWQDAQTILSRYQIKYVVVGPREKDEYQTNPQKFQGHLTQVFQSGSVIIFEVPNAVSSNSTNQSN